MSTSGSGSWVRVADGLDEGRVTTVTVPHADSSLQICLTRVGDRYGALDNACPHQGGPLGEGSIEKGEGGACWLRCPWHGWDYDPITGKSPGGYDDGITTYPVELRGDGIYVQLPPPPAPPWTTMNVMVETMVAAGVQDVFGMVGHSNLGLAEAVRQAAESGELNYFGIRHEGAAAFAASAYGKLTGDPAACLTIAGPGATNLLTGMWDAKVDRAPVLALTGQVEQQVFGPGAFQELPLQEAFQGVTAFSHLALPGSKHAELMTLAVRHAKGHEGVAHLVFPDDVQTLPAEDVPAGTPDGRILAQRTRPDASAFDPALQALREAKRPVIIVGHGARFDMEAVTALAEKLDCPVLTTFKGKGLIGDCGGPGGGHDLGGGVLGRSGTPVASWFMNECDLLLVFGASFSNHTGITPKKTTIQVDRDPMQIGRFHAIDLPVVGDLGVVASAFCDGLGDEAAAISQRAEVAERWAIWRAEKQRRLADDRGEGLSTAAVFDAVNRLMPKDAIYACDVGNNTYGFGRYVEATGRQAVLMSGYLGSIGFGYPAALGAWAATRREGRWENRFFGRRVVAVTGDGGFGQYPFEITTAVKYGMNIVHVLLENRELGKITKEQRSGQWAKWETDLVNPDIAAMVSSAGGLGLRAATREELDDAIGKALAHDGPATVVVATDVELV